jgi:hypothetical protein
MKLTRRIALFACSLGWHRGAFAKAPRREGVAPGDHRGHAHYYCRCCGLVGELDVHGDWHPAVALVGAWSAPLASTPRPRERSPRRDRPRPAPATPAAWGARPTGWGPVPRPGPPTSRRPGTTPGLLRSRP